MDSEMAGVPGERCVISLCAVLTQINGLLGVASPSLLCYKGGYILTAANQKHIKVVN